MKIRNFILTAALGVAICSFGACASSHHDSKPMASLYERLGGKDAITAVVDAFVGNVAGDGRINQRFAKTDIDHLKQMLVAQIGEATGGPMKYKGRDMRSAHHGMMIRDGEFTALVEDLVKALDQFHVPEREKGELIGLLAPMKPDIVGQ